MQSVDITLTSFKVLKHLFTPLSLTDYVTSTDTEAVVMTGAGVFFRESTKVETGTDHSPRFVLACGSVINVHRVVAYIRVLIGDVEGERGKPSDGDRSGVDGLGVHIAGGC